MVRYPTTRSFDSYYTSHWGLTSVTEDTCSLEHVVNWLKKSQVHPPRLIILQTTVWCQNQYCVLFWAAIGLPSFPSGIPSGLLPVVGPTREQNQHLNCVATQLRNKWRPRLDDCKTGGEGKSGWWGAQKNRRWIRPLETDNTNTYNRHRNLQ